MKTKYFVMLGIFGLLISSFFLIGIFYNPLEKIDCDSYGAIYLKSSESNKSSEIADSLSVVVAVPEENKIIARTEILECPSFDYNSYLNMEGYVE